MEKSVTHKMYQLFYFIVFVSVSLPIACNYIPDSGEIAMWLARLESVTEGLRQGRFELFPNIETVVTFDGQGNAFDSNLWLILPGVLQLSVNNLVFIYRLFMLFLQIGTLFAAAGLFRTLFKDDMKTFMGALFYVTWPYRLYITYDQVDWGRGIAFMLMPLFVRMMIVLYTKKTKWISFLGAGIVWAGIAYADWVTAFILLAVVGVSVVWYKKWHGILVGAMGIAFYLPGMTYLLKYLLWGGMDGYGLPLNSIMPKGYGFGHFFAMFQYAEGYPGMGIGLLGAVMILLGICFVYKEFKWKKQYNFAVITVIVLLVASLQNCPWDLLQRVTVPLMRMIALWESPTVFFGCAAIPLSILGVYGMDEIQKGNTKRWEIIIAVAISCVGAAAYTCNSLTYSRLPLILE